MQSNIYPKIYILLGVDIIMVTQEFELIPKPGCTVQNVGFRPSLAFASTNYDVKVCPQNRDTGSVYVAIKGNAEDVRRYWNAIKNKQISPPVDVDIRTGKCVDFIVTELRDREEISEQDIDYCLDVLQLGESAKGVKVLSEMIKIMTAD